MASKPLDWLKVGSYDADWPATVIEDRQEAAQPADREPAPLSPSLKAQWALVLLPWSLVTLAIVLVASWKVA